MGGVSAALLLVSVVCYGHPPSIGLLGCLGCARIRLGCSACGQDVTGVLGGLGLVTKDHVCGRA